MLLRCSSRSTATSPSSGDDDQAIYRFRGASPKNLLDFAARVPRRDRRSARAQPPLRQAHPRRRRGRGRPAARAHPEEAEGRERRARPLLALPLRARPGAGGRRRGRAADRRGRAPNEICVLVRSVKGEGATMASALEERAIPRSHLRRRRLLPASRGPRRARLAARARRPGRLGRRRARAVATPDRAALGRRRAAHPARAPAQARYAERGRRRARGPAALRGGA